ncbi:MAG: mandelate racemase/muconate lactonizing enzyme family protein [Spirochaetota bacterium]
MTIAAIEAATLTGTRPRAAGHNARLGAHGQSVRVPTVRIVTDEGVAGFGFSKADVDRLAPLLGRDPVKLVAADGRVVTEALDAEFPLLDLVGRIRGVPVHRLVSSSRYGATVSDPAFDPSRPAPLAVPCYDTSLYIDDLDLATDDEAAALIGSEARQGWERGHRSFKLKVGRGARWMETDAGTRRDIAVIRAVRAEIGPDAKLMIDANNGYTLNLAKRVLVETADCAVHWIEEPFHEDRVLCEDLREWLDAEGMATLLADGEGDASPRIEQMVRDGVIDVLQYDLHDHGFSAWLETGARLDGWGRLSAPHHYGRFHGNAASAHLAPAIAGFTMVEWDEADVPEIDASAYMVADGFVTVPERPGFGLELDEDRWAAAVAREGRRIG